MSKSAFRFLNISKHFGAVRVLEHVDLDVAQGECFALTGLNGSGKTTLIKCLMDFLRPDSGRIELLGLPSTIADARANLSFLPEKFSPPYFFKGREFVDYLLALGGETATDNQIVHICRELDLEPAVLTSSVHQLSKGMSQKLGLAACFLSEKPLLVLDEPMSGLDPMARSRVRALMQRTRKAGTTILFSSHSFEDIEEISDRLAILDAGRLIFSGAAQALKQDFSSDDLEQAFLRCVTDTSRSLVESRA